MQDFEKAMRGGADASAQLPVATDVAETADAFVFTADLPGVQRADTKVPPPHPANALRRHHLAALPQSAPA